MAPRHKTPVTLCVFALLFSLIPTGQAGDEEDESQVRWTEARILEPLPHGGKRAPVRRFEIAIHPDWLAARNAIQAEQRAVVAGWSRVALDEGFESESRIAAVLMAAEMRTQVVVRFCLRHLELRLEKRAFRGDDDEEKSRPCVYALHHMGWAPVPHIQEFLRDRPIPESHAKDLALILRRICSRETAGAILEVWSSEAGDVLRQNVQAVLNHL